MRNRISWTTRLDDGVKREVRVTVGKKDLKWQYKCSDDDGWDYDTPPSDEDWDALENILVRRTGRGKDISTLKKIQKVRAANA